MTEEVKNVVENIDSMLEQLKMYMQDEAAPEAEGGDEVQEGTFDPAIEEVNKPMEKQEQDPQAIMEKLSSGESLTDEELEYLMSMVGASKSEDASSDADERVGENTDVSEDALSAVKALLAKAGKNQTAQKSGKPAKGETDSEAVKRLASSVEQIAKGLMNVQQTQESMLEGFGLADQVAKNAEGGQSVEKSGGKAPSRDTGDSQAVIEHLRRELGLDTAAKDQSGGQKSREDVRKDLRSAMGTIFRQDQ